MNNFMYRNPAIAGGLTFVGIMFGILTGIVLQLSFIGGMFTLKPILVMISCLSISVICIMIPLLSYMSVCRKLSEDNQELNQVIYIQRGSGRDRNSRSNHWQSDTIDEDDLDGDGQGDDSLRRLGLLR